MQCLGEMAVYATISGASFLQLSLNVVLYESLFCATPTGGYLHMAERYIHLSAGLALGWMNWYSGLTVCPLRSSRPPWSSVSLVAHKSLLLKSTDDPPLLLSFKLLDRDEQRQTRGFITLLLVLCAGFNLLGARCTESPSFVSP